MKTNWCQSRIHPNNQDGHNPTNKKLDEIDKLGICILPASLNKKHIYSKK